MIALHTFMRFTDGMCETYLHAAEKHSAYTTRLNHHSLDEVREFLAGCRKYNNDTGGDFNSIIEEEIAEYIEASLVGDREKAKRELLDVAAVVLREWERIAK